MGYYNWGEQVGNSFMSMFAQNQQKRLEEKRIGMEQRRLQQAQMQLDDQLKTSEQQRSLLGMQIGELEKTNKFWGGIPDVAQRLSDTNNDGIYNDLDTPTMVPAQFAHLTKGLSWDPYQLKSFNNGKWQEDTQWYRGDQAENLLNIYMKNQENASGTWEGQQDRINSTRNAQISAGPGYAQAALAREENNRLAKIQNSIVSNENWAQWSKIAWTDGRGNLYPQTKRWGSTQADVDRAITSLARELGVTTEEARGYIANSLQNRATNFAFDQKKSSDDEYTLEGENKYKQASPGQNAINTRTGGPLRSQDVSRSISNPTYGTYKGKAVRYNSKTGKWEVV
jgi:hypothetical protein